MTDRTGEPTLSVTLDGTPLLGRRTGIGRYTEHLLGALAGRPGISAGATAFTARGWRRLAGAVPAGVRTRALPVPARALRLAWTRAEWPPVTAFSGRCDVFHGTNFVLPPTGRSAGVVTIHDLAFLTMPETVDATARALRELVPRSLRRAGAVCTPTAAVAAQLQDAYGPALPEVFVTHLGVEPRWLEVAAPDPIERARLELPANYLLFVGTREPRKDLATLIEAYRLLTGSRKPTATGLELLLVGPDGWGPTQQPVPGVHIRGYLSQHDLPAIVAGAIALVMPSRYEGFGLPVLEALATGTEVIISDTPALVEVAGPHGRVFPVGDREALAALLLTLEGESLAQEMIRQQRQTRRTYASSWTWSRCAEHTVAAYRVAIR